MELFEAILELIVVFLEILVEFEPGVALLIVAGFVTIVGLILLFGAL